MKKIRSLLMILLVVAFALPISVKAETEKPEANKEPVQIYMFRGEGCTYCEAALEWFDSIEEEYGDYFDLNTYEVWYDSDNSSLMDDVADLMGDTASGVPYIILGNYSYPSGFSSDSVVDSDTGETMGEQLIARMLEIYESDTRYDVMEELSNKPNYDNVVGVVTVIVIAGLIAVAVIARKQNS